MRGSLKYLAYALLIALFPATVLVQSGWVTQNNAQSYITRNANNAYAVTITQQNTSACTLKLVSGTTTAFSVCGTTITGNISGFTIASQATGDLIFASSSTAWSRRAAVALGQVLISQGTSTAPVWSATMAVNGWTPAGGTAAVTGNETVSGALTSIGGTATAGTFGVSLTVATAHSTGNIAANASVLAYTVGAADGQFEISAFLMATTATSFNFIATVTYTDTGNNARTQDIFFIWPPNGGTDVTMTNARGAIYSGLPLLIRAKAGTTITIATSGTFTTVTYDIDATIRRLS